MTEASASGNAAAAGHKLRGKKGSKTMKRIKSIIIIAAIVAVTAFTTYQITVNKMFEVANTRAANAYSYGKTQGYDYAVQTARLTADNGKTYIITYGEDDGNQYSR